MASSLTLRSVSQVADENGWGGIEFIDNDH
jgi:hypothetical protein